jgi:cell division protein FtsB
MTDTRTPPQQAAPKRRKKRRRSRIGTVAFIVLLVALGLVATGVLPVRDYLGRENEVNAARSRLETLQQQNAELADDVEALYSEQEIERIAREQYGFVLPGEVGYVVLTPDEPPPAPASPEPVTVVPQERSLLRRIMDFITGSDIATDG